MPHIISYPGKYSPEDDIENVNYQNLEHHFGFFEMQNASMRPTQEDALAWEVLDQSLDSLSPEDIAKRLWTTYRILDEQVINNHYIAGTTASTTIYDGKDHLITATLADAASFAAVYDNNGAVLGVVRLNSVTHKPTDPDEAQRILETGGFVSHNRVNGMLAISRAIGDRAFKQIGVCSEATIDLTSIDDLATRFNINRADIGEIQIITTCDGFTDGATNDTKRSHERFLYQSIKEIIKSNRNKPEVELAKALALQAKAKGSSDNITVAIQTITPNTPFMLGVYDGHGGDETSTYVAQHIADEFKQQCTLTSAEYKEQQWSVENNDLGYQRDNSELVRNERKMQESILNKEECMAIIAQLRTLTVNYQNDLSKKNREIHLIIEILMEVLNNSPINQDTINKYFEVLNKKEEGKALSNLQIIQNNKDQSTGYFIAAIAAISVTLVTGLLPGLAIIGIVYALTGKTPMDLFKPHSERFQERLSEVDEQNDLNQFKME